jgi:pimeloyl-ACP methyl ester carboxylesterase
MQKFTSGLRPTLEPFIMYHVERASSTEFIRLRRHDQHVRTWGSPKSELTPWVLLHGWMDVSASFQFLVDQLQASPFIIAPDWRGFGPTQALAQDQFWFPDYLADLDFLLDHFESKLNTSKFHLIGHSMGGNVALAYAGVRAERVQKVVNMEGFGLASTRPSMAPKRLTRWLNELHALHQGQLDLKEYESLQGVVRRLQLNNPKLSLDQAQWLAPHWAKQTPTGAWQIQGHPAHKVVNPYLYQSQEMQELLKCIEAPVLSLHSSEREVFKQLSNSYHFEEYLERMTALKNITHQEIKDSAHMLHHDQPQAVAQAIELFLMDKHSDV